MAKRTSRRPSTEDPHSKSEIDPAPGELEIIQAFINTAESWARPEKLTSPELLAHWMARWRLTPEAPELTVTDLEHALTLRSGMRETLRSDDGAKPDAQILSAFDQATADKLLRLRINTRGRVYLTEAANAAGGLGRLLAVFATARTGEPDTRLKICADVQCGTAFYDRSPGRQRKWCSARCSTRQAGRDFRRRRGIKPRRRKPS